MKVLMWMSGGFDRRTPSEHLLVAIVQALYKSGNTVHIIQKDMGGTLPHLPESLENLGVTTDCIPCRLAAKSNFVGRYFVELRYIFKSIRFIKAHKDSMAVFNQSSTVAGFMTYAIKHIIPNARLSYNVQDIFPENAAYIGSVKGIVYKILSAEQRYAYRHVDQIITISEDMKELLIEKGADSQKIDVVYNWSYSDSLYRYEDVYNEKIAMFLSSNKFNVVYAGNIGTMQNVDVVVETAKLMHDEEDVHFHIFGDGIYKERLQHKAEGLNNISFWPMQPSELAPSIYAMADVNVIPLAPNIYRTALPSKTATCIACGKPIVFCIGRESKLINILEQNGLCAFVPSDDAKCLAESVLNLKKSLRDRTFLDEKFHQYFERERNSNEYSRLITGA